MVSEKVSYIAGIKIDRVKIFVYALTGMLCGIAGAIITSRLNSAQPTAGAGYELDAIAAVVLGGTSLAGGRGRYRWHINWCPNYRYPQQWVEYSRRFQFLSTSL